MKKQIVIISTQNFFRKNDFSNTLAILVKILEDSYLREHNTGMLITMLRYSIERFPE